MVVFQSALMFQAVNCHQYPKFSNMKSERTLTAYLVAAFVYILLLQCEFVDIRAAESGSHVGNVNNDIINC